MTISSKPLLILVAGARGAIASTLAVALAALREGDFSIRSSLTTADRLSLLGPCENTWMAGWDIGTDPLSDAVDAHGVLPPDIRSAHREAVDILPIRPAPEAGRPPEQQVAQIENDIQAFVQAHTGCRPVLVNLLPSAPRIQNENNRNLGELLREAVQSGVPDLCYAVAALRSGIPVVNFTPNNIELPRVVEAAETAGTPLSGRDGKTGQTYLKVLLASGLRARNLTVDGWYSLNILGNADGRNLMDPARAAGKLANKTDILDEVLGYPVGESCGEPAHKVHIDYYPPRGDAKEAWDVIDFRSLFGLPMSLRLNLQGRDSILAAPMVIDLARWMAAAKAAGISGLISDLAFYYKMPLGENTPKSFQDQVARLDGLEKRIEKGSEDSRGRRIQVKR